MAESTCPEGGGKHAGMRVTFFYLGNHAFEGIYFLGKVFATGLGAFKAQAELEILFVADENIGLGSDLVESLVKLSIPSGPEAGPIVQIKGNQGAVLLRRFGES